MNQYLPVENRGGRRRRGTKEPMAARTTAEAWTTVGSSIASFLFVWAMIRQYCPYELRRYLEKFTHRLMSFFDPYLRVSIYEFTGTRLKRSEAYAAVEAYLGANSSKTAKRLKAEVGKDSKKIVITMDEYEKVTDEYQGVKVWWASTKTAAPPRPTGGYGGYYPEPERRYYKLTFHKRYREMITESYLEHVLKRGKEIRVKNRQRKLYTNGTGHRWSSNKQWSHIPFEHPARFETMAMEAKKKQEIMEDLQTFTESKDFYARIGKAWKRGYLLYGPPGTGKSTMIAAMANFLSYDVYDLELTAVKDNTELRKLLIETTSKSIIVIEDIDCSLDLTGQRKKKTEGKSEQGKKEAQPKEPKEPKEDSLNRVTLSGLLNFIDGIWSASGGERIIVFTTNYVEKLDPALIRRGRMDKHIELSYCSFEGFKVLAKSYLLVEAHPLFESIELLMGETKITPADVAEALMPKSPREDAEKCLSNLIRALEEAKKEAAMKKAKEESPSQEVEPAKEESRLQEPAMEDSRAQEPVEEDSLLQDKQETEKPL